MRRMNDKLSWYLKVFEKRAFAELFTGIVLGFNFSMSAEINFFFGRLILLACCFGVYVHSHCLFCNFSFRNHYSFSCISQTFPALTSSIHFVVVLGRHIVVSTNNGISKRRKSLLASITSQQVTETTSLNEKVGRY